MVPWPMYQTQRIALNRQTLVAHVKRTGSRLTEVEQDMQRMKLGMVLLLVLHTTIRLLP